jgi:7-cyano-7-deazaguanine reductase
MVIEREHVKILGQKKKGAEATLLGKNIKAPTTYDPSVLVRVPRLLARQENDISALSFSGVDVWNCYEVSALYRNGFPFYLKTQIRYSSDSEFLVESKSLKLYLNSFNMEKFDDPTQMLDVVAVDLTRLLQTKVEVGNRDFYSNNNNEYKNILSVVDQSKLYTNNYKVNQVLLKDYHVKGGRAMWRFDGFRSNCKITGAPDYASVFINCYNDIQLIPDSLLRYLVSYRNENHFHEECCELIFNDIASALHGPTQLTVQCNYTRRGGIDINPVRATRNIGYNFEGFEVGRTQWQ